MQASERGNCRSCGAAILWVRSAASGRAMPLNPEPVAGGNVVLNDEGRAEYLSLRERSQHLGPPLYVSHFTTCPDSQSWRKT